MACEERDQLLAQLRRLQLRHAARKRSPPSTSTPLKISSIATAAAVVATSSAWSSLRGIYPFGKRPLI
jgi:hypothetical protein